MKPRAAALAFAAPLLFTAPALADHGLSSNGVSANVSIQTHNGALQWTIGDRGYGSYGHRSNRHYIYGSHGYNDRQMRRAAFRACRSAIRQEAHYIGFRDVDFYRGRYAERIGPRGFRVTFDNVSFEGRRRDFNRPVTCIVRRGDQVRDIRGIPEPGRRGHNSRRGYYR